MKLFIMLIFLVPALAAAASAPECKFQKIEVDPFTKKPPYVATEKVRLTDWLMGVIDRERGDNSEFQMWAVRERGQDFLALKVRLRRTLRTEPSGDDIRNGLTIPKDAELLVLMADRSVVQLHANEATTGNTRYEIDEGMYVIDTSTTIRYRLDADTTEQLTKQDATRMRFKAVGRMGFVNARGVIDFTITKKGRQRFEHALACLGELGVENQTSNI